MKIVAAIVGAMMLAACSAETAEKNQPVTDNAPTLPAQPADNDSFVCADALPGSYALVPVGTVGVGACAALAEQLHAFTQSTLVLAKANDGSFPGYSLDRESCALSGATTTAGVATITELTWADDGLRVRREITTDACNLSVTTTAQRQSQ